MESEAFILVVDHDPGNRVLATRQLEILGYAARAAASGMEAVDVVRAELPRLVLVDCSMPGMDGCQTAQAIRQLPGAGSIPILGLTGDASPATAEAFRVAGANDVIRRPVLLDDLRAAIEKWATSCRPPGRVTSSPTEGRNQVLARLRNETDEETTQRIVSIYLERMDERIAAIRAAIASEDPGALKEAAHAMRSATTVFDAPELASACAALESLGETGGIALAPDALAQAERAARELRTSLEDEVPPGDRG